MRAVRKEMQLNSRKIHKKTPYRVLRGIHTYTHIVGVSGLFPELNNSGRHIHITLKSCYLVFNGKEIICEQ